LNIKLLKILIGAKKIFAETLPPGKQQGPPPPPGEIDNCKPNFITSQDSCWSALQNLEEITKKFQRCNLEKMAIDQLFWDCEQNMITSLKSFVRKTEENQQKYSRNFNSRLNEAISAKEEHSRNYDRLLSDQTKNYTAEIKSIASLAGNLKNYETKFTATDLRFQQMTDKVASLQDKILKSSIEMEKLKTSLTKYKEKCFFNVGINKDEFPSREETIKFTLEGAMSSPCGYDKNSGVFTVEKPGLYLFAITLSRTTYAETSVQLRVDQQNICHTYHRYDQYTNSGNYLYIKDTLTCTTIQDLKVGQKVDVYLRSGSLVHFKDYFPSNQFQGVLLR